MDDKMGFEVPSKDAIESAPKADFAPLVADDYIAKVVDIQFSQKNGYNVNTGAYDGPLVWSYTLILSIYGLKSRDKLEDTNGKEVLPFTSFLYKDVNPYSTGFTPAGLPSTLRGFIANVTKTDVNAGLKVPTFILLKTEPSGNRIIVDDPTLREEFYEKMSNKEIMGGYMAVPDIRGFKGKYIGCALITKEDAKGRIKNAIGSFGKVPNSFVVTDELEALAQKNFTDYQAKIAEYKAKKEGAAKPATESDDIGEVEIEDLPI